ncbi:MAG: TetR/AcrR family transcriptional regulator [Pseudomonadota bacterium]|jgi:AcrR family transcriptional regulator|nr:TetR/AcrR family transcriptional regulator [Pseudomonadota bacterium]QKK06282.1 MAG: TetR/AcrR family transcriptional regulator [Pseudomonadota bacterium]
MTVKKDIAERKTAELRKQEIVLTTLKLAEKVGPDRLSAAMVARDIGISQPAIFRHFSGMNLLWLAVASHIEEAMKKKWKRALNSERDEVEKLQALVLTQLRIIQSVPAIPSILFSRELHAGNRGLRQAFLKIMHTLHKHIVNIIVAGQENGSFRRDVQAADCAYLVMGFIQGLAVRWSVSDKNFHLVDEGKRLFSIQINVFLNADASLSGDEI